MAREDGMGGNIPRAAGPLSSDRSINQVVEEDSNYTFEDAVAYIKDKYPDAKPDERYIMATRHFYKMTGKGIPEWLRQESDVITNPLPETDADKNRSLPLTDSWQGPPMSGEMRSKRYAIAKQIGDHRTAALAKMGIYNPYDLRGRVTSTDVRTNEKVPVYNRGRPNVFAGNVNTPMQPKPRKVKTWAEFFGKG